MQNCVICVTCDLSRRKYIFKYVLPSTNLSHIPEGCNGECDPFAVSLGCKRNLCHIAYDNTTPDMLESPGKFYKFTETMIYTYYDNVLKILDINERKWVYETEFDEKIETIITNGKFMHIIVGNIIISIKVGWIMQYVNEIMNNLLMYLPNELALLSVTYV